MYMHANINIFVISVSLSPLTSTLCVLSVA